MEYEWTTSGAPACRVALRVSLVLLRPRARISPLLASTNTQPRKGFRGKQDHRSPLIIAAPPSVESYTKEQKRNNKKNKRE